MKSFSLAVLLAAALMVAGCSQETTTQQTQVVKTVSSDRVLRHVVMFKFKADATPDQIRTVVDAFRALPGKIDAVRGFEWGTNVSPEHHDQGYTHVFFLTFTSEADRDTYLHHPEHQKFAGLVGPVLEPGGVHVMDYWAQK